MAHAPWLLTEVQDAVAWNAFVQQHAADGGWLQSWWWGQMVESSGHRVWRWAATTGDGSEWAAVIQVYSVSLPFGQKYWYAPRGPVGDKAAAAWLLQQVVAQAAAHGVFLVRIDPAWSADTPRPTGWSTAPVDMQPRQTLALDLQPTPEVLLQQMHAKTRYNLNLAGRKELRVVWGGAELVDDFYSLVQETSRRQGIGSHGIAHYRAIMEKIPADYVRLVVAYANDRPAAAHLVVFWGDWAIYLHGGSDYELRHTMASILLYWQTMQEAKNRGCRWYDLFGVSTTNPAWEGITRIKQGLSPQTGVTTYIGALDYPVQRWRYQLYQLYRRFR